MPEKLHPPMHPGEIRWIASLSRSMPSSRCRPHDAEGVRVLSRAAVIAVVGFGD